MQKKTNSLACTLSGVFVTIVSTFIAIEICVFCFTGRHSIDSSVDRLFSDVDLDVITQIDSTVYMNKYGMYIVPKNHIRPAIYAIKTGRVWEQSTLSFVKKNYLQGTDIIHAGAYFGDMLPFYSNLVGHSNTVWAFEPIQLHFICAEMTRELNGLQNVVLQHAALSNESNILSMETGCGSELHGGGSSIKAFAEEKQERHCFFQTVKSVSLDDLLLSTITSTPSPRVSVVHLDVEGHEQLALQGARALLRRDRPIVILEMLPKQRRNLDAYMEQQLHYRKQLCLDGNCVFIPMSPEEREMATARQESILRLKGRL